VRLDAKEYKATEGFLYHQIDYPQAQVITMSEQPTFQPSEQRPVPTAQGPMPSNVIYIGKKSPMVYSVAVLMQLNTSTEGVTLKARGRSITTAVDTIEILKRRFLGGRLTIKVIKIGTEVMPPREGLRERNVSTIEITVIKTE
jgi:DNA-binding protein